MRSPNRFISTYAIERYESAMESPKERMVTGLFGGSAALKKNCRASRLVVDRSAAEREKASNSGKSAAKHKCISEVSLCTIQTNGSVQKPLYKMLPLESKTIDGV